MTKKLSSKLLSVILTIAICATTVFGCLMTVNAAGACCYEWSDGTVVDEELTTATISLTFTAVDPVAEDGINGVQFDWTEVDPDAANYLVLEDVKATDGNPTETTNGETFNANDFNIAVGTNGYSIIVDSEVAYSTVKLEFTFSFADGAAKADTEYGVKAENIVLAGPFGEIHDTCTGETVTGVISSGCNHVITVVGEPMEVDTENNYSVYKNSVCAICGEPFGYQLVPTAEALDNIDAENVIYYDGAGGVEPTETDADGNILIKTANHLRWVVQNGSEADTTKTYKVADGIDAIVLQPEYKINKIGGFAALKSATSEQVKAWFSTQIDGEDWNNWHSAGDDGFAATFDGNGVTIYGMSNKGGYTGLFHKVAGNAVIKNINVTKSYMVASYAAGGIVGTHKGDGTNTLTIENCSVTDSYIESTGTTYSCTAAAILGYESNCSSWNEADKQIDNNGDGDMEDTVWINGIFKINNCFVKLDSGYLVSAYNADNDTTLGGIAGFANTNAGAMTNCVTIGVTPYATCLKTTNNGHQHTALASHFTNIYTDQASGTVEIGGSVKTQDYTGRIFQLTTDQMKGSAGAVNMSTLDWGTTWVMDGTDTYPRLVKPGETSDTIYWDGTVATSIAEGSGTKDAPYIINTAAELAYLIGLKEETAGVYYKVADGIKNIVLQPYAYGNDIMALGSASAVKTYFESGTFTEWVEKGWEGSSFCGTFDGNGATVYGLYMVSASNAGLFSTVDAGATIKNIAVKNSYLVSQSSGANYQVGAIAAVASGDDYGVKDQGAFWFNNCTVANCYMYNNCTSERSGVIFGCANYDVACIDNCLVYGNDATYGDGLVMGLTGLSKNNLTAEGAPVPEGLTTVLNGTFINSMVRNSIVLGNNVMNVNTGYGYRKNSPDCFVNVYTDGASGTVNFTSGSFTYTDDQIKAISAADALGAAAKTNMPNLTWGTDWYYGAEGEYPTLAVFTSATSIYANPDYTLYGSSVTYNNDGSFDLNIHFVPPYEGFSGELYVGNTECSKFYKLTATESSYRSDISDNAMMFTIPNLSAKYIDTIWLPTLVANDAAQTQWGQSYELAIADNARAVLAGDYSQADKNVSAAVLKYGDASKAALSITTNDYDAGTVDLLEFGDYLIDDLGSTSKLYDNKLADNGETGADWDNAIIIDSAEEFVYLAKASGSDTAGLYYKVADGIAGFNLSTDALDLDGTLADNLAIIQGSGKNHSGGTPGFQGHFDGNGVTVYGAWTNHTEGNVSEYAGLFSCTAGDVTIKNVNVKLSYFVATLSAGGIVGYHKGDGTSVLTIENCSVTECHIESQGTTGWGSSVGAVIGLEQNSSSYTDTEDTDGDGNTTETIWVNGRWYVNNCYVNLDPDHFVSAMAADNIAIKGGVCGMANTNGDTDNYGANVNNCIVIGVTPYSTQLSTANNNVQHSGLNTHFSNVYTDQATGKIFIGGSVSWEGYTQDFTGKVYQLTTEQMTGAAAKANMPALDWINTWTTTDGYPTFINKDYEAPASGTTIYWDGTVATGFAGGTGTKEDPYIIATASQLAYIVKDNASVTPGKYFKVADGISNIVLQKADYADDIIALGSAADVKTYFEANAASMAKWPNYGWEGSSFGGCFDGNGATVYGLYQTSTNNAGLFSSVDGGATVKNIALKNSYLTSSATNYQVGGIMAVANSTSYGRKLEGVIWINGCTVANCYMYNTATSAERSGVMAGGMSSDVVMIDNCITYGNDATYGDGVKMPLIATGNNDLEEALTKPAELTDYILNSGFICNSVRNSIILDCDVMNSKIGRSHRKNGPNCYVNVYTNGASGTVTYPDATTFTYTEDQVKPIAVADVLGDAATDIVSALNTANGSTVWYVGATGDHPGFKKAGNMPTSVQALYDAIILDTADDYGDSTNEFGVYATALSLKVNPYISFAFAFHGDYKTNRENIKVRFTYTVNGTATTTDEISVPACEYNEDGTLKEIRNVDGWTNTKSAGRYHTYKAEGIPVEALANGIKVEASYNGGEYVNFGTFSAEGLAIEFDNANKVTPSDYYATRVEAAKALLFYTQMLHARYGNVE